MGDEDEPDRQRSWADAAAHLRDVERERLEFLFGWTEEIAAAHAYSRVPTRAGDAVGIDPRHVIDRLGPVLTAMSRAVARDQRMAASVADSADTDLRDHTGSVAFGARDTLAVGLGVHLGLPLVEARWLADALIGHDSLTPTLRAMLDAPEKA